MYATPQLLDRPAVHKRWHRPLVALAMVMGLLAVLCLIGLLVDQRQITGAAAWLKPLKFALSVGIYGLTLSRLLALMPVRRRLSWWLGTIAAVFLATEMVIIVGAAIAGTTSHFNVATPFAAALWTTMAVSIVIVWVATTVVAALLWRADLGDRGRVVAIRAGLVIAIIGMGVAFLMTGPQGTQISHYQGVIGAHTVGAVDGGPGLPLVGWSTENGDLRIPHFVGMHALQLLPVAAFVLELMARRVTALRSVVIRWRILGVLILLYVALLAVLTLQALAGQSIVQPDATVTTVTVALLVGATTAIAVIVVRGRVLAQPRVS